MCMLNWRFDSNRFRSDSLNTVQIHLRSQIYRIHKVQDSERDSMSLVGEWSCQLDRFDTIGLHKHLNIAR